MIRLLVHAGAWNAPDEKAKQDELDTHIRMDGKVRMDAILMDSEYRLGSVIQVSHVKNPILLAKSLLEHPMHSTLVGEGAELYAGEIGMKAWNTATPKQIKVYEDIITKLGGNISYEYVRERYEELSADVLCTCGCVIRDESGLIVSGNSTGGLECCYPGRAGDTGMVGNGAYASRFSGAACSGIGEKIMRVTLARYVTLLKEQGLSLDEACQKGIEAVKDINGEAGVIAVSADGEISIAYNTEVFPHAMRRG